ncbi:hypothetical protein [Streptomyces venetus]
MSTSGSSVRAAHVRRHPDAAERPPRRTCGIGIQSAASVGGG